jgi:hypothetical protein
LKAEIEDTEFLNRIVGKGYLEKYTKTNLKNCEK